VVITARTTDKYNGYRSTGRTADSRARTSRRPTTVRFRMCRFRSARGLPTRRSPPGYRAGGQRGGRGLLCPTEGCCSIPVCPAAAEAPADRVYAHARHRRGARARAALPRRADKRDHRAAAGPAGRHFPTVTAPNPEDRTRFPRHCAPEEEKGAPSASRPVPDADRIGVAVKTRTTNGSRSRNQIGCILLEHILSSMNRLNRLPGNGVVIKSTCHTLADAYLRGIRRAL
jgi:hypothetical protein